MSRIINKLTRMNQRKVEDFILENKSSIERGVFTVQDLANKLAQRLNTTVTPANVTGAAKTVGISIGHTAAHHNGNSLNSLRQLKAAVSILAKEIIDVRGQLGLTVSPILQELSEASHEDTQSS